MDYNNLSISIVIPVYKSRDSITDLAISLDATMKDLASTWEVIFVVDGCPQYSELAVLQVCERFQNFKGLVLARNRGQHYATLVGLKHAKGDFVITMDDDLQNPTSEIAKILASTKDSHQIVIGVPRVMRQNRFRSLSSRMMQSLVSRILGKPKSLKFSSFRCLTRHAVNLISQYNGVYPYMPVLMLNAIPVHEIANVEVEHEDRKLGKSSYSIRQLVKLASFLLINHSMILLRAVAIMGIGIACLSMCTSVFYIIKYFIHDAAPAGWTSLAVLVSLLSGFILVSLGVIGEYIGRLVLQTDADARYVVYREIGDWSSNE